MPEINLNLNKIKEIVIYFLKLSKDYRCCQNETLWLVSWFVLKYVNPSTPYICLLNICLTKTSVSFDKNWPYFNIYYVYNIYIYIYIYLYSLYNSRMKLIKSAQWEEQRYHNWVRWISVIICYFKFYVKTIFRHIQCLFILSQWLNGSMTLYKRLKRWEIFILFKKNVFLFLIYTLRRHCDLFFLNINSRTRTCDVTVPLSIP